MSRPISLLVLLAGCLGFATAAPYGPEGELVKWVQPGGQKLTLRVFGDEYFGRTQTSDGYTVVYNPADGAYHYARLAADGSKFVPSGIKADQAPPANQAKQLNLPVSSIRQIRAQRKALYDGDRPQLWDQRVKAAETLRAAQNGMRIRAADASAAKANAAPIVGTKRGLTIIAQFPDDPRTSGQDAINFPTTRAKIARYSNEVGYKEDGNTGSIRDYFFDQSLGKMTYLQTVTEIITLPRPRNYYNFSDYPTNKAFRGDAGRVLLKDALDVLKTAKFDFTGLTVDAASRAIATNIFFAGENSGVWSQGLWPHQWQLASPVSVGTSAKPVFISAYQITNIENSAPTIGTFIHENGHLLLNYPDLYDYDGDSQGVGGHCLMGSGNFSNGGKTPSPLNAYFKDLVGWASVTDVVATDFRTVSLPTTGNVAYRFLKPGQPSEFFILENRGEGDKWAAGVPDKGIAIWHVDDAVYGNDSQEMTEGEHYQVSLEQADGAFDLENNQNRGDARDLFDLGRSKFNDTTLPNSKWWDGSKSSVVLQVLGDVGPSTRVLFGAIPPDTILLTRPNGGEMIFRNSSYPITWDSNIVGNVNIELLKGGVLDTVLATNAPNSGSFIWNVSSTSRPGSDYSVRISSLTNPVPSSDSSFSPFTITNATFPSGGKMPYGWITPKSAANGWKITRTDPYEGKYSLSSEPIGDGKSATVAYKSNFKAGTMSFYLKVDSEQGFDFASFSINGIKQVLQGSLGTKGITGGGSWRFFNFPVPAGTHTFAWTYSKDDSYAGGKDKAWLDGVSFPPTTQEIAVEEPVGKDLVHGKTLMSFPATAYGSASPARKITVRNVGKAALTGLSVKKSGTGGNDFVVRALGATNLDPGKSTTFEVVFTPGKMGLKQAVIHILSNDVDEPAFAISLEGTGIGLPKIAVSQPQDIRLKDGNSLINFGKTPIKSSGKTRKFTVTNRGTAILKNLAVTNKSPNNKSFKVGDLGAISLAPGESTTFNVVFVPSVLGTQTASLRITSNDKKSGPFNIKLSGQGAPRSSAKMAGNASSLMNAVFGSDGLNASSNASAITSTEVIAGQKYLALTVNKSTGTVHTVEVSSNLLDWYSGENHTTVLVDDATTLKVRDNTPITSGAKRYIQLKSAKP
ncbi:MAG: M6 family metalloprotease domain-containing protein [Akkermansiaceae bacterium]